MTHANVLNRKLEEVYGVGKEFTTVAALWGKFSDLIRDQQVSVCQGAWALAVLLSSRSVLMLLCGIVLIID